MNLIFNAEALRPPITGIGNYTYHLLEQYLAKDSFDSISCFSGTDWVSGEEQLARSNAHREQSDQVKPSTKERAVADIRLVIGKIPGTKALYDNIMDHRFKRAANATKNAVYHETNYIFKPYDGPCVTTVHDLSHVLHPEFHPPEVVERLDRLLPMSLQRADSIITVSNVVRDELISHYRISPERVHTVYEGVDPLYRPRSEADTMDVLSKFGLRYKSYVLMVATLEPRKGIDGLLDAWDILPLALKREFPLVLTGSSGWRNDGLRERIERMKVQGTVFHLGYVAAEVLPVLYSGASVFSYPSIYEGFGLPVLDAMSSGVPTICRAGTSMAEFSEGACVLSTTPSPEELASQLSELLQSQALQAQWSQAGVAQAAKFSWEKCAQETAALYRQLV